MITRKSSIHELELAGSNARFHVDLLTRAIYGVTVPELLQKGVNVVSYYRTCPFCGANLDPGEVCECKEEAALGAGNTGDGRVEQIDDAVSASHYTEN